MTRKIKNWHGKKNTDCDNLGFFLLDRTIVIRLRVIWVTWALHGWKPELSCLVLSKKQLTRVTQLSTFFLNRVKTATCLDPRLSKVITHSSLVKKNVPKRALTNSQKWSFGPKNKNHPTYREFEISVHLPPPYPNFKTHKTFVLHRLIMRIYLMIPKLNTILLQRDLKNQKVGPTTLI